MQCKRQKALLESDTISPGVILMLDDMYLQICAHYSGGDFTRCDEHGNVFKGFGNFSGSRSEKICICGDQVFLDSSSSYIA